MNEVVSSTQLTLSRQYGWSWNGGNLAEDEFSFYVGSPADNPRGAESPLTLVLRCPFGHSLREGHSSICQLPIVRGDPQFPRFGWNGSLERPTLSPSIGCDIRCGFHGHLMDGRIFR